ncbi:MAG: branched-chain amino acid ABC transporter permease [Betaproteobacteria bacterium]|nr:branched-chain amino acid ABC transporter permease [Betaproteobacteria bacterium]
MQLGPSPASALPKPASWPVWLLLTLAAAALGFWMHGAGLDYYLSMISRMMIYGLAACSLNLILGYGGLVSFGHAAYLGIGAYTVGILITEGMPNGWLGFGLAMVVSALLALVIGAISLRTKGVYFIMITLAFAQMLFYLVNSVKAYGGDEGLNIKMRSDFGLGIVLKNNLHFFLLVLFCLVVCLAFMHMVMRSRMGRVVLAQRDDDIRTEALGFAVYRYQLALFVMAGAIGGLAGALLVNQQNYVSPNLMHWTQSGVLMIMVILGGVGTLAGGLWGALLLLTLEDLIAEVTPHWQFYVGWVLLAVVLLAPKGLSGLPDLWRRKPTPPSGGDA